MKRILLICLALVLALGSLGVAGALWWDDLYIDGYVYTGDIGVEWSIQGYYDSEAPDKDVSSINAYFVGDDIWIDIYNAYPCITYTLEWDLHCTGSIPVHFAGPWITGNLPAGVTLTFTDMAGDLIDWPTVQLHEDGTLYGKLTVHLDNTVAQDASFGFLIELIYHQYNEAY